MTEPFIWLCCFGAGVSQEHDWETLLCMMYVHVRVHRAFLWCKGLRLSLKVNAHLEGDTFTQGIVSMSLLTTKTSVIEIPTTSLLQAGPRVQYPLFCASPTSALSTSPMRRQTMLFIPTTAPLIHSSPYRCKWGSIVCVWISGSLRTEM